MAIVSIVHTDDLSEEMIRDTVHKAMEQSEFRIPERPHSVVLKVNLRYYWDFSTGETTDPRVVSAIIDYLRDHCNRKFDIHIAEADASAMRTTHAFRMLGYEDLAKTKSVGLVNLCEIEKVDKPVAVGNMKFVLPVAKLMLDADTVINVPKLRTHRLTTISCGLKNFFGAIAKPRKITYHPHLNDVIVAANKILKSHLTVIDGLIALGKWPLKMGLVLASTDQLATDYVAAEVMGYNPRRITHLMTAEREGIGTCRNIKIKGTKALSDFSRVFPRENYAAFNLLWEMKLRALDLYIRLTKDTRPPVLDR